MPRSLGDPVPEARSEYFPCREVGHAGRAVPGSEAVLLERITAMPFWAARSARDR
jgi:hypothetical protein